MTSTLALEPDRTRTLRQFALYTVVTAAIAATAALISILLGYAIWAMFIGWVAYSTRGHTLRRGLANLGCTILGIGIGVCATRAIDTLMPIFGLLSFAPVLFTITAIVIALRAIPPLNNVPAYFLGLICFFAGSVEPTLDGYSELAAPVMLGALCAWLSQAMQIRIQPATRHQSDVLSSNRRRPN
jgi:hypothetical protein